jgi:C_GCAxxG_C_C family probable redox protein
MKTHEIAEKTFVDGSNCAQAVFTAFCERYGIDRGSGMMLCSPLGGGIAYTGNTCGAVTGALLVIGLHFGQADVEEGFNSRASDMATEFLRRFEALYSDADCRGLLGYDISDPDQKAEIRSLNLFNTRCPGFVAGAALILEQLLKE